MNKFVMAVLGAAALLFCLAMLAWPLWITPAHAQGAPQVPSYAQPGAQPNKGYDVEHDPIAQWFKGLARPPVPPGAETDPPATASCCGEGDGYPIEILQEATINGTADDGIFRILDGTAKHNPDGTYRPEIPNWPNLRIPFPGYKVTELKDGNPTKTAWAFLSVYNNEIHYIYCVVPLPPGL